MLIPNPFNHKKFKVVIVVWLVNNVNVFSLLYTK